MFLLVPAYPGCPGSKAVKRSLLLLLLSHKTDMPNKICWCHSLLHTVAVLAVTGLCFLPARRHASMGTSYGPVSVFVSVTSRCSGMSVCVCHKSVFHTGQLVTADSCNILLSVFVPAYSCIASCDRVSWPPNPTLPCVLFLRSFCLF